MGLVKEASQLAKRRRKAHQIKPGAGPGEGNSAERQVGGQLAPHVQGHVGLGPRLGPNPRARALETLSQQIPEAQPFRVHVVKLPDRWHVLNPLAGSKTAAHEIAIFAATQIVPVRPQLGRETSDSFEYFAAYAKVPATRHRAFRTDFLRMISLLVVRDRQRIDAIWAAVVHPGWLAAVPISEDASADQARMRIRPAGLTDLTKIILGDAMIVVDESQNPVFDQRDGAIQSVRLSSDWLLGPAQWNPIFAVRLIFIHL